MTVDTFFEKFEEFADAPDAVERMRELVLDLAIQGKLVDQDTSDEPASNLLEKIDAESTDSKKRLTKSFGNTEHPFRNPDGWIWERLGFLAVIERGGSPRPIKDYVTEDPDGLNWIKIGDTEKGGRYITSTREKIRREGLKKTRKVFPGDFLLTNSMSFGRPYITKIEGCIHDGWLRIHPPQQIDSDFLYYLLSSSYVYSFFCNAAAGAVVQNLNADKVRELPIPLPPLAEQKRIVAKVDELMGWCDQLEAQQQERDAGAAQLARASLARFADAPTPANLNFLFHPSYTIPPADLRKSILTLAVQGKLVPQDPKATSESALGDILAEPSFNGISKGPTTDTTATEVLRISAGTSPEDFYVDESDFKHVELSAAEIQKATLLAGDLLACRYNGNLHFVGKFSLYQAKSGRTQVNPDKLIRFRVDQGRCNPRYVCYAMNSAPTRSKIEAMCATTAGNIGLSAGKIKTVSFPLPPLAEQKRIVAKVDELMALVDELESQLNDSRDTAKNLLEALVAELTAAGAPDPIKSTS